MFPSFIHPIIFNYAHLSLPLSLILIFDISFLLSIFFMQLIVALGEREERIVFGDLQEMDTDLLWTYLNKKGVSPEILEIMKDNKIDGKAFSDLSKDGRDVIGLSEEQYNSLLPG